MQGHVRTVIEAVLLVCALFCWSLVHAQGYPKGPVRIVVPFPPGGGVDTAGRLLAIQLSRNIGGSIVIENRSGANGNIGTEVVAKASPDGQTLLFTGAGFVTNPSLYKKVPYDPIKEFEPIALMALGPNVLVVHPSVPARTVRELIAHAKTKPGEIGFAGAGSGSTPHLAGELFNQMAGVQLVHIPYRGSGPAMIGLLSGEVPVMFLPAINAGQHVATGKLRALAVTSLQRLGSMPDLPTMAESGLPGYESAQWYGVLAPAGTPADILAMLNAHVAKIMQSPEMRARMHDDGLVPVGGSREQFAHHIKAEIAKWARVIQASGARVD
ncbi:MAG: tripartite tricarboxylate transporter substrate binding protein [Burkholderiales bacterium]